MVMQKRELTIIEAVVIVLRSESRTMTAKELHDNIVARDLFRFGARDPISMVRMTISRHLRRERDRGESPRVQRVGRDSYAIARD